MLRRGSFLARRNKHRQYLEFFLYCISVEDKKPKKSEAKYLDLFNRLLDHINHTIGGFISYDRIDLFNILLNHIIHTIGGFGSISHDRIDFSHGPK